MKPSLPKIATWVHGFATAAVFWLFMLSDEKSSLIPLVALLLTVPFSVAREVKRGDE